LFLFPTTIALESVKSPVSSVDQLQFPVICKRRSACSSTEAHQMTVIPTLADLHHIQGYGDTEPVILQDFIPHDGVIVKVYVIDGKMHISTRPSFKNTCTDSGKSSKKRKTGKFHSRVLIHFDSQQLPKTFADEPPNDISKDLQQCLLTQDKNHMHEIKEQALDYERLQKITDCLWENLGLTFFGYDILLKSESNEYYICDVNYFPSFKNVPNFHCLFIQVLKNRLGM
ncbi:inositol-tetrakisphosphate 1-kinase, partial [Radiomyces spectabilis]|uniref:inositol-tetrakisphosphate 1-kinase n=1 Tax=Radiomyces spectabilis TaxID=64574 RepID=UPI002220240C